MGFDSWRGEGKGRWRRRLWSEVRTYSFGQAFWFGGSLELGFLQIAGELFDAGTFGGLLVGCSDGCRGIGRGGVAGSSNGATVAVLGPAATKVLMVVAVLGPAVTGALEAAVVMEIAAVASAVGRGSVTRYVRIGRVMDVRSDILTSRSLTGATTVRALRLLTLLDGDDDGHFGVLEIRCI